ncbi:MAG: hypothetical protein Q8P56_06525, partial [Candidatus Uhrbacteria bacterium]|nr:hypothetical protein [Candidatus Uhrbacteria bacterium]
NVPTTERRPAEETREIDSAQSELLKDPNIDVVLDEFWDAHRLLNEDHSYPRNITPYLSGLLLEIEKGIKLSTNNVEIKNLTKTERWIQNYLADIEKTLMLGDDYFIERTLVAMNEILSLPPTTFRDRMLRAMSALHGSIGMPQPIRAMIAKHSQDYTNPEKRRSLVMFTAEYMRNALFEFIFSANLWQVSARPDAELMDLWRQGITAPSQNPLIEIAKKIAQLERQKYRPTATGRDISLVPVKGPLLAYAGDIGDACYTRLHKDIAQGAYPNMTGYIFVENRGTQKETMRGSCLMIEAKTDEGKPILLMRGNNPRKNLLRQFDAWTFVKQTLISFDRIRKERDAVALGIPWDKAGTSSSNREEVSDVYQKIVRWMKRRNRGVAVTLKQSPETEFNDYNNWDPERGHPVILLTADDISELAKLETLGDS